MENIDPETPVNPNDDASPLLTAGNFESIVSEKEYTRGETKVEKTLSEMVASEFQKLTNKILLYILTTIAGAGVVIIWNLNSKVSELEGKYSSPDKLIETVGSRLDKLELENKQLLEKNYKLEIEKLELKNKSKK